MDGQNLKRQGSMPRTNITNFVVVIKIIDRKYERLEAFRLDNIFPRIYLCCNGQDGWMDVDTLVVPH